MISLEQILLARGVLDTKDLRPVVGNEPGTVRDHLLNVWRWDGTIFSLFVASVPCMAVGIWLITRHTRPAGSAHSV